MYTQRECFLSLLVATSLNKKKTKKLISEIHILPKIIYNENRRNEAKGIRKISWFCSANFIINVKSCGKWWHVNHIPSFTFFLLFFMERRLERRHPVIVAILLLYMGKTLNPNDKSHRNIFKFFFCWTYFGADFLCILERDKIKWTRHFPFSYVFHL